MIKKVLRGTTINKRELQKKKKNIQQLSPYPNRVKIIAVTKSQEGSHECWRVVSKDFAAANGG